MENEVWKDIPGYEGLYMASSLGNIKSMARFKAGKNLPEKLMKSFQCTGPYLQIMLGKGGKKTNFRVHRLIAITFLENSDNKPTVNHKNGIKNDNRLENLEWSTYKENNDHSHRVLGNKNTFVDHNPSIYNKRLGKDNKNSRLIYQFDLNGSFIKEWYGSGEILRALGLDKTCVLRCCNGKRGHVGGFMWKYVNN